MSYLRNYRAELLGQYVTEEIEVTSLMGGTFAERYIRENFTLREPAPDLQLDDVLGETERRARAHELEAKEFAAKREREGAKAMKFESEFRAAIVANQQPTKRRLVVCGECRQPSCGFSYWIDG